MPSAEAVYRLSKFNHMLLLPVCLRTVWAIYLECLDLQT